MKNLASDITFIIVNYRSKHELLRCLCDLSKIAQKNDRINVIIVNNDTLPLVINNYHGLHILIHNICHNIGYGAANNIGLRLTTTRYTCFLNPDTHSFPCNFLTIINHINDHSIISPCIKSEDGTPQKWSCGDKISLIQLIKNHCFLHNTPWTSKQKTTVRWVSGAALFGNTSFLRSIGGFDEDFFLYYEDVDLCERAILNGGSVYYLPDIAIVHTSGQSSRNDHGMQKKMYYRSQDIFLQKHANRYTVFIVRFFRFFLLLR